MGLLPRGLSVPMEDVKAVPPPGLLTLNCLFICKSTHTIISTYGKSFRGPRSSLELWIPSNVNKERKKLIQFGRFSHLPVAVVDDD